MLADFQRYWHGDQDEIHLLLDWTDPDAAARHRLAAMCGVGAEALIILLALHLPGGPPSRYEAPEIRLEARHVTPVFVPQDMRDFPFTQTQPQRAKPATEVNLEQLLPRPELIPSPAPAPRVFTAPPAQEQPRVETARLEPPRIEVEQRGVSGLPSEPAPALPPVREKPPLAFESVGPAQGRPSGETAGQPSIRPPGASVEEAAREVLRSGTGGRIVVGDVGELQGGGVGEVLRQSPAPGRTGSALELLSDPLGVDFRPYLIQVLAAVRRNWMAVMPESARFGQRGRAVIQFSINRGGGVPKLVIAAPSGTTALDRAAVAGISASTPFPPLPAEYRGAEIRLQLVFSYNMPAR
jgi:TonB family protein